MTKINIQEELDKLYKETGKYPSRKEMVSIGKQFGKRILIRDKDLYIIQCLETQRVKIGISDNVVSRFESIRTMSPTKLSILKVIEYGGLGLEQHLHKKFGEYRLHGEWFEYNGELKKFIEDILLM